MHAGIRVLAVIHRVVVVLLTGEVHVEVHVGCDILGNKEPSGRIHPDILAEFADRDGVAGPLGHLDLLAVFHHSYHLDEIHLQGSFRITERSQGCVHAHHIAVVIGAPEIHQFGITALDLVYMVGDIRRQIREASVALAEHTVLVIAVIRALKPESSVLLIGQILFVHDCQAVPDHLRIIFIEERFMHPGIKPDAIEFKILFDLRKLPLHAFRPEIGTAL